MQGRFRCIAAIVGFVNLLQLCMQVPVAAEEPAVEILNSCNEDAFTVLDRAKVFYSVSDSSIEYPNLYAVNGDCYKCSKQLVANGTDTDSANDVYSCASLWTPYAWTLHLVDADTGHSLVSKEHTFGERGQYYIQATAGGGNGWSITIHEQEAPIDSYTPLWILFGILFGLAALSYALPLLSRRFKLDFLFGSDTDLTSTAHHGANTDSSAALLLDSEAPSAASTSSVADTMGNGQYATRISDRVSVRAESESNNNNNNKKKKKKKKTRVIALDTFRGFSLLIMIFVNYGGGGYYFFEHSAWNGLTVADLLFPWFMWMMGVSMALSFSSLLPRVGNESTSSTKEGINMPRLWYRVVKRTCILFGLGLFLSNGYNYERWRIPGVLQYFAISYFVTSATVLVLFPYTQGHLQDIHDRVVTCERLGEYSVRRNPNEWPASSGLTKPEHVDAAAPGVSEALRYLLKTPSMLGGYWLEWVVQAVLLGIYLAITLGVAAPGCPVGYNGPGGRSDHTAHPHCTGGIHRYVDMQIVGFKHFYHSPTCLSLYDCIPYDPEGLLGSMAACTLTYLGLMSGRVLLHYKEHAHRLVLWSCGALLLCLVGAALCSFSQNDGFIPINKNLWSVSFVFVSAGGGLFGLGLCYILIDVLGAWSGAPCLYLGMNSILFYCAHEIFWEYMPFSYHVKTVEHGPILLMNCIGVASWVLLSYYCYRIKFFVKI